MKKNEQVLTSSLKRIIYISIFLLVISMSNIIDITGISPKTVYAGTLIPKVTAIASSYVDPYGPERAVDSDVIHKYSRWYCKDGYKSLVLDLKQNYKIDRWVVQNIGALGWSVNENARDYRLLASMDNNTWRVIDIVTDNIANSTDKTIPVTVIARYVKLEVIQGNQNNNNWTSIAEFSVYAASASISSVNVPADGTYGVGDNLDFIVNFDGNVNLSGIASNLSLNLGDKIKQAGFFSKTANSITYRYTVQSEELDKNGIAIGTLLNLNGDTITDSLNSDVSTTLNNVGNTSKIFVESGYKITIPSLTGGIISTTPAGKALVGSNVTVNVSTNPGMRLKENTLKYNDGSDHFITGNTFNMPNKDVTISAEFEGIPLTVSADLTDGTTVKSGKNVILTSEDGAKIYYTMGTNPTDPTAGSNWILSGNGVTIIGVPGDVIKVKAYAVKTGRTDSAINTFTYNIEVEPPAVNSVSINPPSANIVQGKSLQLTANVSVTNGAANTVNWSSSDLSNKISVNNTGLVTVAKDAAVGNYTITAVSTADQSKRGRAIITVKEAEKPVKVTSVALNATSLNWTVGQTGTFITTVLPSNATNKGVTWKSSNPLVAKVYATGKVTGVAVGTATITCTAADGSGKSAKCVVTVTNPTLVTSIALSKTSLSVVKGNGYTLTATILPTNATNKAVTWKSSNPLVAKVDATGKVTGVAVGTATITCTAADGSGKSATCAVTVTNPTLVTSIALSKTSLSVVKGNGYTLTATILPTNATNKAVTWKSSNPLVAKVDATGKVTGVAVGTATITCTAADGSGKSATCAVTVTNPTLVTSIALSKTSLSVVKGNGYTLTATILPTNATNKAVTWKSSNPLVAKVDATGRVTGVAVGTATITCTAADGSGKSATCAVTVTNPTLVTSIALSKTSLSVVKGNGYTLTATILPTNATNKAVTWKSSNSLVAKVDATGKVTGVAVGTATITCTAADGSGKSATCAVTVTNPTLVTSIALSKTSLSVVKGNGYTLTATILPTNATNKAVTWKSSNSLVAKVDATGKVTGVVAGTATITCTTADGSAKYGTCVVTVTV